MEDLRIVELYRRRDEQAIVETDCKYGAYCRRISENVLSSREDADECVNDTYHAAWTHIPPDAPVSLRAYLGRIVRNLSLSRYRKNRAAKRYEGMELLLSELNDCIPALDCPEKVLESAELTGYLNAWLRSLDPETMEISGKNAEDFDAAYEAWYEDRSAQRAYAESYSADDLSDFVRRSTLELLSGTDGENRVYSPLNVYMALAMLAEVTDGSSRAQILSLLGVDSLDTLRTRTNAIWKANYRDDGVMTCLLANSLWLDEDVSFRQDTLEGLASDYFVSSYRGQMGDAAYDKALQDWLNEQTGGLLEEQVGGLEFSPETVFALASTVYFCAKWQNEFSEARTEDGTFHAASGDVPCKFMYQSGSETYYWGGQFGAISRSFSEGGRMWFLLPDEGKTVDDLLVDPEVMDFILADGDWENNKYLTVNQRIVKFDVSSQLDLSEGLQALGVSDVFDAAASDFSPMTDMDGLFVSQTAHGARVAIDEEGCTAAAYTVMMACGAAEPPEEEIDFVLDRPFVFAITGEDGLPLFIGVVNQP